VDAALRLRQTQPLDRDRTDALCGFESGLWPRLWLARRNSARWRKVAGVAL